MSWVLLGVLPADLVSLIHAMTFDVLCRCRDCGRVLLVQDCEPAVRSGETFAYSVAYGALEVAVTDERRARLLPLSSPPPFRRRTLDLPTQTPDETRFHTCGEQPDSFHCHGDWFSNAVPRMTMRVPFTRLGNIALCLRCRGTRKAVRASFEAWVRTTTPPRGLQT